MSDKELTKVVENEVEWRKLLWKKFEKMEQEFDSARNAQVEFQKEMLVTVTTLKVKYGFIAGIFGSIGGILSTMAYYTRIK